MEDDWRDPMFLGATALWAAADEGFSKEDVKQEVASRLRTRLRARVAALNLTVLETDELMLECRRQIAEAALNGDIEAVETLTVCILSLMAPENR